EGGDIEGQGRVHHVFRLHALEADKAFAGVVFLAYVLDEDFRLTAKRSTVLLSLDIGVSDGDYAVVHANPGEAGRLEGGVLLGGEGGVAAAAVGAAPGDKKGDGVVVVLVSHKLGELGAFEGDGGAEVTRV